MAALIIVLVMMYIIHGEIRTKIHTSIQLVNESTDNLPIIYEQMQSTQLSTVRTSNRLNISTSSVPLLRLPVSTEHAEPRNMNQKSGHEVQENEFPKEKFIFYNRYECGYKVSEFPRCFACLHGLNLREGLHSIKSSTYISGASRVSQIGKGVPDPNVA